MRELSRPSRHLRNDHISSDLIIDFRHFLPSHSAITRINFQVKVKLCCGVHCPSSQSETCLGLPAMVHGGPKFRRNVTIAVGPAHVEISIGDPLRSTISHVLGICRVCHRSFLSQSPSHSRDLLAFIHRHTPRHPRARSPVNTRVYTIPIYTTWLQRREASAAFASPSIAVVQ